MPLANDYKIYLFNRDWKKLFYNWNNRKVYILFYIKTMLKVTLTYFLYFFIKSVFNSNSLILVDS